MSKHTLAQSKSNNTRKTEITFDYDWLIKKNACYWDGGESKMGEWVRNRLPMSIETLQRSSKIPVIDKMWVLYRLMSDDQLCLFARCRAWSVVGSWAAPAVVKEWLLTGASAAASAAYFAARSAARSAAYAAADHAADSAAYAAAYSAARSAAYAAAYAAARSAADAAYAARSAAYSAARSAELKTAVGILNNTITEVTQ